MKDDDIDNLIYRTKLSTPIQPKPNTYSWKKWSKLLSTLTTRSSPTRLKQKLGKWYQSHSKSGRWLAYQEEDKIYAKLIHSETEWNIYTRWNKSSQLSCVNTTATYTPTSTSIPVKVRISAGGKIYSELGAELIIQDELPIGPIITFQDLINNQVKWIRDLLVFVQFAPDPRTYGAMATIIL